MSLNCRCLWFIINFMNKPINKAKLGLGRQINYHISNRMSFSSSSSSHSSVHYLDRGKERSVAYRVLTGDNPGIIFLPGFQSHMDGLKAKALQDYCKERNLAYTRFDYQACGNSPGDIKDVTISTWKSDVLAVLDELTAGPQVLVGSSMGGWLMLMIAMERKHRLHSLVGIATAADMAKRKGQLTDKQKAELEEMGSATFESEYGSIQLTKAFIDSFQTHDILAKEKLDINCPVRLIHGMKDDVVPYTISIDIAQKIWSEDIDIILRKNGGHRMSQPEDIKLLYQTLDKLIYHKKELQNVLGLYSSI